jgi:hypothetical protein
LDKDRLKFIAINAQNRAMRDHTYAVRAKEIIICLGGNLLLGGE